MPRSPLVRYALALPVFGFVAAQTLPAALAQTCSVQSGESITPVIELYTSEGCSSCPPADKWLSTLKGIKPAPVVQAFHVNYWDYIGCADRFAVPAHTARQRQVSAWQNSGTIYTPQMVKDGRDWRNWSTNLGAANDPAQLSITLKQESGNLVTAQISLTALQAASTPWAAYWTVTEHGHASKVLRGENSGEHLKHDFVVTQYQPVPSGQGAGKLVLQTRAKDLAHERQINLVLFNPQTGKPLQAASLSCS